MDPFLGEIRLFPWGWAPSGWLTCEGQILPFNSNVALASLLGNCYGGDGKTTFGLPDLRGRAALGQNPVPSIAPNPVIAVHALGSSGGTETVTLNASSLAIHAVSSTSTGLLSKPTYITAVGSVLINLNSATVAPTPAIPVVNMQPSIVGCFCIATSGIYPTRP